MGKGKTGVAGASSSTSLQQVSTSTQRQFKGKRGLDGDALVSCLTCGRSQHGQNGKMGEAIGTSGVRLQQVST